MTAKQFINGLARGQDDVLKQVVEAVAQLNIDCRAVDGLAVNAYREPVVSLDLDSPDHFANRTNRKRTPNRE